MFLNQLSKNVYLCGKYVNLATLLIIPEFEKPETRDRYRGASVKQVFKH